MENEITHRFLCKGVSEEREAKKKKEQLIGESTTTKRLKTVLLYITTISESTTLEFNWTTS
jgi:hypothetical protein